MASSSRRRRQIRFSRRWIAALALVVVGFLYYSPVRSYLETREDVARRQTEVDGLAAERSALERRLARQTSTRALVRDARRLGYVRPGERLFIVKGIPEWRQARHRERRARG